MVLKIANYALKLIVSCSQINSEFWVQNHYRGYEFFIALNDAHDTLNHDLSIELIL